MDRDTCKRNLVPRAFPLKVDLQGKSPGNEVAVNEEISRGILRYVGHEQNHPLD